MITLKHNHKIKWLLLIKGLDITLKDKVLKVSRIMYKLPLALCIQANNMLKVK